MNRTTSSLVLLGACASLLLGACNAEDVAPTDEDAQVMVGRAGEVSDDVLLAIVFDGDELIGYSCGGEVNVATHTRWFSGKVDAEEAFSLETDGWTLTGRRAGDGASGTLLAPSGRTLAWSLEEVALSEPGGLYWAAGTACKTGVIVVPSEGAHAIQGASCNEHGVREQVTPVRPEAIAADRFEVWTPLGGMLHQVEVERLSP